jgi:hypothetical protein
MDDDSCRRVLGSISLVVPGADSKRHDHCARDAVGGGSVGLGDGSFPASVGADSQSVFQPMKLLTTLVGFLLGAMLSFFVAGAYVSTTYSCRPGPGEPCDAGGLVGMGLVMVLAPVLGLVFAAIGYRLALRRERRRRHEQERAPSA